MLKYFDFLAWFKNLMQSWTTQKSVENTHHFFLGYEILFMFWSDIFCIEI